MNNLLQKLFEKRIAVLITLLVIIALGISSYTKLKIDVFPDPSPIVVQLYTEAEGMAAQEVERFISYPVETSLYGLPNIEKITSVSTFGLSTVNIYFNEKIDIYFARQLVSQELPRIKGLLPDNSEGPKLGSLTTALGMIYIYALESTQSSRELRTLQDWLIKYQLKATPGVATVLSHGGGVKQFQIKLNPLLMRKYSLHLHDIVERVEKDSENITAGYIKKNNEEFLIRGIGLIKSIDDLKHTMVKKIAGKPIFLSQIAKVEEGDSIKRGEALLNDQKSSVAGIIMKLTGTNTSQLIERLDKKIEEINSNLDKDTKIVTVYDQGKIIKSAFRTISEALIIGIVLVALILLLFIKDLKSAIISSMAIPFALFISFIVMYLFGLTADLMSLGGLAIGIGLMVDATLVVVENIIKNRELKQNEFNTNTIIQSVSQLARPLCYAMLIIIISFLPILTLSGTEGKMFKPFGITLVTALVSALIYAIFIAPIVFSFRIKNTNFKEKKNIIFDKLQQGYLKIFDFSYKRKKLTSVVFVVIFIISVLIVTQRGSEFIPTLNEETYQLEITLPPNTDLEQTVSFMSQLHKKLGEIKSIKDKFCRIGRGESETHPHPVNQANTIITFKNDISKEESKEILHKIREIVKDDFPQALLNISQPIKHNLDHLLTGVRADFAIKIFGEDYAKLLKYAQVCKNLLTSVEGIVDLQVSQVSGQNEIRVVANREKMAQYDLNMDEVMDTVHTALGGKSINKMYQGDTFFNIFIRYDEDFRNSEEKVRNLLIFNKENAAVPLGSIATVESVQGYSSIKRENGKRYVVIQGNVSGKDIGSVVKQSEEILKSDLKLPNNYFFKFSGQFELKEKAEKKLLIMLLVTIAFILFILWDFLKNSKDLLIILINIPISLSGGVIALALGNSYFSVPASIGFIALLGITLENTLILITFLKRKTLEYKDFDEGVRESVALRLRPILMTKFTTIIGLVPLLFASGIGSEIQKPMAIVVIGGIIFSIFTTLILMPLIFEKFYKKV